MMEQEAIHDVKVVVERIITLAPEKQVKVKNKQPKGPWTPEYAEPKITTINVPTSDTWWAQYMTVERRPALSTLDPDCTSVHKTALPDERSPKKCSGASRTLSVKRKLDKYVQELLQEESDEAIREVYCRKKGCCRFLKSRPPSLLTPSIVETEDIPSQNVVKPSTLNLLLSGARYMKFPEENHQDLHVSQLVFKEGFRDMHDFSLISKTESCMHDSELISSYRDKVKRNNSVERPAPILLLESLSATDASTESLSQCPSFSFDNASYDVNQQIKVEMHAPQVDSEHSNTSLADRADDEDANLILKREILSPKADPLCSNSLSSLVSIAADASSDLLHPECSTANSPPRVSASDQANEIPNAEKIVDHSVMKSIPIKVKNGIDHPDTRRICEPRSASSQESESKYLGAPVKLEPEDYLEHNSEEGTVNGLPIIWVKCEARDCLGSAQVNSADTCHNLEKEDLKLVPEVTEAVEGLRSFRKNKKLKPTSEEGSINNVSSGRGLVFTSDAQTKSSATSVSEVKVASENESQVEENCCDSGGELVVDGASRLVESKKYEKVLDLRCPHCPFTAKYKSVMAKHNEVHKTEGVHYCPQCDMSTRDTEVYRLHLMVHHERDSYTCEHCDYTTLNQVLYIQHINKHTDKTYACSNCSYTTGFRKDFQYHQLQHSKQQVLKCSHCAFVTKYQHNFKQHLSTHTGTGLYFCRLCSFSTAWDRNFSRHMTKHKRERAASNIEDATAKEFISSSETPKPSLDSPKSFNECDTRELNHPNSLDNWENKACPPPSSSYVQEATEQITSNSSDKRGARKCTSSNLSDECEITDCAPPSSLDEQHSTLKCSTSNFSLEHENVECSSSNFCGS